MAAALLAVNFGANHEEAAVLGGGDGVRHRLEEARPAGAAVELRIGGEQCLSAAGAHKRALAVFLVERAGTGTLGAVLAQHAVLLGRERTAPFSLALGYGKALLLALAPLEHDPRSSGTRPPPGKTGLKVGRNQLLRSRCRSPSSGREIRARVGIVIQGKPCGSRAFSPFKSTCRWPRAAINGPAESRSRCSIRPSSAWRPMPASPATASLVPWAPPICPPMPRACAQAWPSSRRISWARIQPRSAASIA